MIRNKYEDEVSSLKKKIKAIKTTQKKNSGEEVVLHKGEPRPENEVLEERLADASKKLELLEKNAPEIMDIKVRLVFALFSLPIDFSWVPRKSCYVGSDLFFLAGCRISGQMIRLFLAGYPAG